MSKISRLQWLCRRGTREMDILCERFLQQSYPGLSVAEKKIFESFLDETDMDIRNWITGQSEPENPAYKAIIQGFKNNGPAGS